MNIVLWGAGRRLERYMEFDYFSECNIVKIVDLNKSGQEICGYRIESIDAVLEGKIDYNYLIVSTQNYEEIYTLCINNNIDQKKIILTDHVADKYMFQNLNTIKAISKKLYEDVRTRKIHCMSQNEKDDFDDKLLVGRGKYSSSEYIRDYNRYRTFEFVADEIIKNNVTGSVAELGVFRGVFSSLINEKFSNKKLYLFDTFEGFDIDEAKDEKEKGRSGEEFEYSHRKTSTDIVLENMPYKNMCIIRKGYFPDTLNKEIEFEKFAFVSIDVDFEKSIYEGLKFFFPRLSEGGYIFLHDYNSQYLEGVKVAVDKYENDMQVRLKKVPIADRAGTLIITK